MSDKHTSSILLFEPENKGHHLQYLQYLTEDFLDGGHSVSVAYDRRNDQAFQRLETAHPGLLAQTTQLNAYGTYNDPLKMAFQCLEQSGADELFMCCLDEITSSLFRKAIFGHRPPKGLKGKISGIFIRPRPLDPSEPDSFNLRLKRAGMNRLLKEGWFRNIFLLDEFLCAVLQKRNLNAQFHFLPDVADAPTRMISKEDARVELGIPADKTVLLHFGTGTKRKGLPLVLEALERVDEPDRFHLIVAGKQEENTAALSEMVSAGRATLLNRFVSEEETDTCFAAADWILLPYIDHYGASNVLARAALANRPVIASDYHLLGRRVEKYRTGLAFHNNDSRNLADILNQSTATPSSFFDAGLLKYGEQFKRERFKSVVLSPYHY
ncbi:glycosyltransferase [Pontiellaceae bacterium B1224]|nr:glycosyltransferase [Pontiellaceae bacterium B1224]